MIELTEMYKKSIVRKFHKLQFIDVASKISISTREGRPCIYDLETISALKRLWELSEKLCGVLLHSMTKEETLQKIVSDRYN